MSIDDEELNSEFSSEDRKLELFTDRYEFTKLFAEYLNDDPPRQKILYFHGDGGNGKSLLLKFLRIQCCKRFSRQKWQELKAIPDDRVAEVADYIQKAKLSQDCTAIPAILHDFGMPPIKEYLPQDPFYGLLMLRRNLGGVTAKYKFKFPVYDFACFWYLLNKGESKETLEKLFPNAWVSFFAPGIEALAPGIDATITEAFITTFTPVAPGVALLKFLDKIRGKDQFVDLIRKRLGVTEKQADAICKKDIDTELIKELPKWFAQDLKAAMAGKNKPERIVLFFDTHEKFWDEKRHFQGEKLFYQDEWLRRLLRGLPLELGVVVVVAGRDHPIEQLRWTDAPKFPIPQQNLDPQLLWHLSPNDARHYLQKAGIEQAELIAALIKYASVNPDEKSGELQVHPFYLGLCADVVLTERMRGIELKAADFASIPKLEDKARELTDRLLRYVDIEVKYAVDSLSACRAFNQELYLNLGRGCCFQASPANFKILTSFSFVWRDQQRGEKWYRIHELLRRLDYERDNSTTREAHEVLEAHYRELGNVAEAIYHANRLDWERGAKEWAEVFDDALQRSRYDLCRTLLEIRGELYIKSDFCLGLISSSEGNYLVQFAQYREAEQKYLEAIEAYNCQLSLNPDDTATLNNKGTVLQSFGQLQAQLSEFEAAKQSYSEAITTFNSALNLAPDDIGVLNNKGIALRTLGELQVQLSEFEAAKQSYSDVIAAYNSALNLAPDDIGALINKGSALQRLGELQAQLSEFEAAKQSYSDAIAAYNSALNLAPDDFAALNNKGNSVRNLGELQAQLSEFEAAKQSYLDAISAYNSALNLVPDSISALNNKGIALRTLGELQGRLSEFEEAKQSYSQAIAAYNSALNLAPDYIIAFNNKGTALRSLGELQAHLSEFEAAKQSYLEAIATYNSALNLTPDYIHALNNKGLTLNSLGELQAKLSEFEEAKQSYSQAIAALNSALNLVPDSIYPLNNKGMTLRSLGELQANLSEFEEAKQSYLEAIAALNSALNLAPDYILALNNKGTALLTLGKLQAQLSEFEEAKQSYSQALAAYNSVLNLASDDNEVLNNKGIVLLCLGNLQVNLSQKQEAQESYQAALAAFNRSLELAPNNESIRNQCDLIQQFLDSL